jgi:hypothetical protein
MNNDGQHPEAPRALGGLQRFWGDFAGPGSAVHPQDGNPALRGEVHHLGHKPVGEVLEGLAREDGLTLPLTEEDGHRGRRLQRRDVGVQDQAVHRTIGKRHGVRTAFRNRIHPNLLEKDRDRLTDYGFTDAANSVRRVGG